MDHRIVVRLELTPGAKERLNEISHKSGMTQLSVTSRLVEWFANQPEIIQASVLGRYPEEIESDVAKLILKRLVDKKK